MKKAIIFLVALFLWTLAIAGGKTLFGSALDTPDATALSVGATNASKVTLGKSGGEVEVADDLRFTHATTPYVYWDNADLRFVAPSATADIYMGGTGVFFSNPTGTFPSLVGSGGSNFTVNASANPLILTGSKVWLTAHQTFTNDTYDIGSADGGTTPERPRDVYIGNSLRIGDTVAGFGAEGDIISGQDTNNYLSWDASAATLRLASSGATTRIESTGESIVIDASASGYIELQPTSSAVGVRLADDGTNGSLWSRTEGSNVFYWNASHGSHLEERTGNLTILSKYTGRDYSNTGAAAQIAFVLPNGVRGHRHRFFCTDTDGIKITAAAGDQILIDGVTSSVAGYIETFDPEASIELYCVDTTTWRAITRQGNWDIYNGTVSVLLQDTPITTTLTDGTATTLFSLNTADGDRVGVEINYTVQTNDATDYASEQGTVQLALVDMSTGVTAGTPGEISVQSGNVGSISNLTTVWTLVTTDDGSIEVQLNADVTGITPTTHQVQWTAKATGATITTP